jgi:hypothetical protein
MRPVRRGSGRYRVLGGRGGKLVKKRIIKSPGVMPGVLGWASRYGSHDLRPRVDGEFWAGSPVHGAGVRRGIRPKRAISPDVEGRLHVSQDADHTRTDVSDAGMTRPPTPLSWFGLPGRRHGGSRKSAEGRRRQSKMRTDAVPESLITQWATRPWASTNRSWMGST